MKYSLALLGPALLVLGCGGEVAARHDAGAGDAAFNAPDVSACGRYSVPSDLSSFSPQYVEPAPPQNACSQTAIQQGIASCVASSSASCTTFKSQEGGCYDCLFAVGGPFVRADVGIARNHGGCVEILDGATGAISCGGKQAALDQCEFATCSAVETVDECADVVTTGLADPGCGAKAASTVCATYAKGVGGCGAGFTQCFGTDEDLAKVFCAKP